MRRLITTLALVAALAIPAGASAAPSDYQFYVSTTGVPAEVGVDRFVALAADAGTRMGLVYVGTTPLVANYNDRRNIVGFGGFNEPDVLAATILYPPQRVRVGTVRRCVRVTRNRLRVRSCRRVATYQLTTQTDIVVVPGFPWAPGPDYPLPEQIDLETVLLHEFGHFAGFEHVPGCNLMAPSIASGEWYRSDTDYSRADCPQ